jgi:hypothetical protein
MAMTLFGQPLKASPAWEDGTTYTFFLRTDGVERGGGAAARPALLHGMPATTGASFRPNLVVSRDGRAGRAFDRYIEDQKQSLRTRLPGSKVTREGSVKVAGLEAREVELHVALDHPLPACVQWHAWLAREDFFYHFCGTSTKDRFPADQKEFKALADSWR